MIQRYISFGIFFLSIFFMKNTFSITDDFSQPLWSSWGDGVHYYDQYSGREDKGALYLSVSSNTKSTYYKEFKNIDNGNYIISFWVKGERVQSGDWSRSFWFFSDGGSGEKSCFEDIQGSFDWSLIRCPVTVTKKKLSAWFRLQSTGRVWIDDFEITKGSIEKRNISLNFVDPLPHEINPFLPCLSNSEEKTKEIFPRGIDFSPFDKFKKINNKKYAHLQNKKFYNLDVDALADVKWRDYDYIELVLISRDKGKTELQMAIEDIDSSDYWSKLNFKSTLVQGENVILFPLKRTVGERGSTRDGRKIDYQALTKIWMTIDPDSKYPNISDLLLKSITLKSKGRIKTFENLLLFDFSEEKDSAFNCFNPVTPFHVLSKNDDYGFVKKIDKVHDSVYADLLNRDVLLVSENEFQVKLPNGKYKVHLNWNMLGLWDVPFWHKRVLSAQGKTVKIETRSNSIDYLQDLLRFEAIEPSHGDHPWDLYLSDIFSPVVFEVQVTNGRLSLGFSADETGAALNWLAIYPLKDKVKGIEFFKNLNSNLKKEFDLIGRYTPGEIIEDQDDHVSYLKTLDRVMPHQNYRTDDTSIELSSIKDMKLLLNFVVYSNEEEALELGVTSSQDKCFSYSWKKGQYQFISQDRNHETYIIGTKQLRDISGKTLISTKMNTQILFELIINPACKSKEVKINLTFKSGKIVKEFPTTIKVFDDSFRKLDFPVGFLGFNPLTYKYFKRDFNSEDIINQKLKWSMKYLDLLLEGGFTTFSLIDQIDDLALNSVMEKAKKSNVIRSVFTYGNEKNFTEYLLRSSPKEVQDLKSRLEKWPSLIHTFSDEAGGYSDRLNEDLELGRKLKKKVPFIKIGGFSSMDKSHRKLNTVFDEGSYSNVSSKELKKIKKWGMYNLASQPLDNSTFSFGLGLYILRAKGLGHLLGWHLSAAQNYPYYDLDGRENDAMMLYPTSSGDLLSTIKYEQAIQGLIDFKLLTILEQKALKSKTKGKEALKWLNSLKRKKILNKSNGQLISFLSEDLASERIRKKAFYFISRL